MYHPIILLLVFAALYPSAGGAKCGMQKYILIGRISAEPSLVQNIRIYPFLEGAEVTGMISDTGKQSPDFVIPNSAGSFEVELWLSTDSGAFSSGGDDCSRKAKYVDLFIAGERVRAKRAQVAFTWAKGAMPRADAGIIKIERAER